MPIYEYECVKCKHRFDKKQSFHDDPVAECPKCNESARRVFHPTPIIFKGSGFYVTDHPKSSNSGSNGISPSTTSESSKTPETSKKSESSKSSSG